MGQRRDLGLLGLSREVDRKMRSLSLGAVDLDVATMHLCEALCYGQTKADAALVELELT